MVSCTLVSSSHGAHNIRNRDSNPETFSIVYFLIGKFHTSLPLWLPFVEEENLMLESHQPAPSSLGIPQERKERLSSLAQGDHE